MTNRMDWLKLYSRSRSGTGMGISYMLVSKCLCSKVIMNWLYSWLHRMFSRGWIRSCNWGKLWLSYRSSSCLHTRSTCIATGSDKFRSGKSGDKFYFQCTRISPNRSPSCICWTATDKAIHSLHNQHWLYTADNSQHYTERTTHIPRSMTTLMSRLRFSRKSIRIHWISKSRSSHRKRLIWVIRRCLWGLSEFHWRYQPISLFMKVKGQITESATSLWYRSLASLRTYKLLCCLMGIVCLPNCRR